MKIHYYKQDLKYFKYGANIQPREDNSLQICLSAATKKELDLKIDAFQLGYEKGFYDGKRGIKRYEDYGGKSWIK